jgi:GNAT superfamily N-acetyltransferase
MRADPPQGGEISPVRDADVEPLCRLAREIWVQHYPGIITVKQIEYMLAQRYSPAVVRAQLNEPGIWWNKLRVNATLAGFSCCELGDEPGSMKLDKLYVHQIYRGKGFGTALIRHAERLAAGNGCRRLYLQVNRGNHGSIAMYRRAGFDVEREVKVEIGNGFVMDDFVLAKRIAEVE